MSRETAGPVPGRGRRALRLLSYVSAWFLLAAVVTGGYRAWATEGEGEGEGDDPATADPDYLDDPDVIARGSEFFGANCAICHGEAGRGIPRERSPEAYGPSLLGVGPAAVDFMLRTGRMPVEDPDAPLRRQEQKVTDAQRRALIAYVASLAPDDEGQAIPELSIPEDPDLARGLEVFTSNCAACHGPTAAGIAVGQRDVSSSLDEAEPIEIAEAVRIGPGVMPVFGEDQLDAEDLEAVVAWVEHLREREAPGGAQIGRSGPVSEGFVAWILGIGLLTIVMYLLGEKAGDDDAEPNA